MGPMMHSQGQTSTHAVSHVPTHFCVITYGMWPLQSTGYARDNWLYFLGALAAITDISVEITARAVNAKTWQRRQHFAPLLNFWRPSLTLTRHARWCVRSRRACRRICRCDA